MDVLPIDLAPGHRIGEFEILGVIGQSPTARVFEARRPGSDERYALKMLLFMATRACSRIQREGELQQLLRHPNIVRVYETLALESGPALVMERVDGPTLGMWLIQQRRGSVSLALELFHGVLKGVGAAHAMGLIHRDLKPDNILLERYGAAWIPRVCDFGLVKAMSDDLAPLTAEGAMMGTPGYMAPEQFQNARDVDLRADLFALGTLLYELLSGSPAFPSPYISEIIAAVAKRDYVPITEACPDVPAHVAAIVDTLLSPDPADRPQSCGEVEEAIFGVRTIPDPAPRALLGIGAEVEIPVDPEADLPTDLSARWLTPTFNERLGQVYPTPAAPPPRRERSPAIRPLVLGSLLLGSGLFAMGAAAVWFVAMFA